MPVAAPAWKASSTRQGGASASWGAQASRAGAAEREEGGRQDDEGEDAGDPGQERGQERGRGSVVGVHEKYSRNGGEGYVVVGGARGYSDQRRHRGWVLRS
jgi:hypothetical protein